MYSLPCFKTRWSCLFKITKANSTQWRNLAKGLGIFPLWSFAVGDDDQKVITFEFCFINACYCGVTWRRGSFFESDLNFLIFGKKSSCDRGKLVEVIQKWFEVYFQLFIWLKHWNLPAWKAHSAPQRLLSLQHHFNMLLVFTKWRRNLIF